MPYRHDLQDYEPLTRRIPAEEKQRIHRKQSGMPPQSMPDESPSSEEWSPRAGKTTRHNATQHDEEYSLHAALDGEPLEPAPPASKTKRATSLLKRGHAFSYAGLFLFTIVVYFRPYELIPALSWFTSMAFVVAMCTLLVFIPSQLTLEGTLTYRPREVNLVLLLCIAALLSIPLAIRPLEAWYAFSDTFLKAVVMFIVTVNVLRTERRLKGMLWLGLVVGLVLSIGALNEYRLGHMTSVQERIGGVIRHGLFENPNDLALYLATLLPLAIVLFLTTRNPLTKIFYVVCAFLAVAANVVTYSRGGFLGLVAAGAVLTWKLSRRNRFNVTLLALVVIVLFLIFAPGDYADRLASIYDRSRDVVGSAGTRQNLLYLSVLTSLRHPLLGVGIGNFHIVSIHEEVTHNAYTQVSAEMGLAACVIYVMFIVSPLRRLRQIERETIAERKRSNYYYLSVGLQASLVGYMVSSFFASVAYLWYIYFLVGYAVCLRRMYEAGKTVTSDE